MIGSLIYCKRILRPDLQREPGTLFVFGDNLARRGYGGQAKEMRGEPNAVGIPTKLWPGMTPDAFLDDTAMHNGAFVECVRDAFTRLREHQGPVVMPLDGIGTGLAGLPALAPRVYAWITAEITSLDGGRTPPWMPDRAGGPS